VSGCFDDTWLQDLVAKKPASVKCVAKLAGGPCSGRTGGAVRRDSRACGLRGHKGATYDVGFEPTSRSDAELKFDASAFGHLLPFWAQPRIYPVRFNTCSDSFVCEVAVYPDVEFGVGVEYKQQRQVDTSKENTAKAEVRKIPIPQRNPSGNSRQRRQARRADPERWAPREVRYEATFVESTVTETKLSDTLSVFGMLKIAGMEINYKNCVKSYIEKIKTTAKVADQVLTVIKNLDEADDEAKLQADLEKKKNAELKAAHRAKTPTAPNLRRTKQTISWPSFQLKVSGLWLELDDSHQCACATRLAVAFKPLIGISYTWDMTPMVLRAFAGVTGGGSVAVAAAWTRIQAWLKERNIDAFRVELVIEGTLEGEIAANHASGAGWSGNFSLDANIKGRIEATLAKIQIDKKKLGLRIQGDIDVGMKGETGFRLRAEYLTDGKNGMYGSAEWTGIKVTVAFKWKTCVSRTECKPDETREDPEELSWTFPGVKSDPYLLCSFEDNT
jgi:hypothetical protein